MTNRDKRFIYANDVADEIWANRHKPKHEKSWNQPKPDHPPEPHHRVHEADVLERRLNDGWDRIEQAQRRGEDTAAWESFWIDLLHQYEAAFDALPEAER